QITGVFWEGSSIRRQTEFILKNLKLTLEAAGSSMAHVLKAQIWLANIGDLPRMEDAWRTAFPQEPPARTVLAATDFGVTGGIIEINLVAVRRHAGRRKEVVSARGPVPLGHAGPAVRAGDLLFLSGLCAATGDGVIPAARVDRGFPYAGSSIRTQTEWILEQADALCRAA